MDSALKRLLCVLCIFTSIAHSYKYSSFDIREKGFKLIKAVDAGQVEDKSCYLHLPIQIATFLYERLNLPKPLSPMTMINCLKMDCKPIKDLKIDQYMELIGKLFENIETIGAQFYENAPYSIDKINNSCDFVPDVEPHKIVFKPKIQEVTTTDTFETLKSEIYQKGSVLGFINTVTTFLSFKFTIFNASESGTAYFFPIRIIGWKIIKTELYWVFNFAIDDSFCSFSFCMIKAGKYSLNVIYES